MGAAEMAWYPGNSLTRPEMDQDGFISTMQEIHISDVSQSPHVAKTLRPQLYSQMVAKTRLPPVDSISDGGGNQHRHGRHHRSELLRKKVEHPAICGLSPFGIAGIIAILDSPTNANDLVAAVYRAVDRSFLQFLSRDRSTRCQTEAGQLGQEHRGVISRRPARAYFLEPHRLQRNCRFRFQISKINHARQIIRRRRRWMADHHDYPGRRNSFRRDLATQVIDDAIEYRRENKRAVSRRQN